MGLDVRRTLLDLLWFPKNVDGQRLGKGYRNIPCCYGDIKLVDISRHFGRPSTEIADNDYEPSSSMRRGAKSIW